VARDPRAGYPVAPLGAGGCSGRLAAGSRWSSRCRVGGPTSWPARNVGPVLRRGGRPRAN